MELSIKEPRDIKELRKAIQNMDLIPEDYIIRIENNIFSIDGNWLLQRAKETKDGSLENINAILESNGDKKNFRSEVRKTTENFEGRWNIDIKKLLYARLDKSDLPGEKPCLTLSYLSVLETGNSTEIEKWKNAGFIWQDIGKVDRTQLTPDTSYTYGVIRQNEKEIQNLLRKYTEFDEKKFDQYFFHGMNNREGLLEGFVFCANTHLTYDKYRKLSLGEKYLTNVEMLVTLKEEVVKKYEQVYRYIYLFDGEDNRFDYHLTPEEKQRVEEMVENKIQELMIGDIFIFNRRGLSFNDRLFDMECGKIKRTYDKARDLGWAKEVYKVIEQLGFMERIDPYQYYSRWLQAKIGRLKESKKYKEEDLEKLEEIYRKYFKTKEQEKGNEGNGKE